MVTDTQERVEYGAVGVTQGMSTDRIGEQPVDLTGRRGGVHGFYLRRDGKPTFQAIDDATFTHLVRHKGHTALFGEDAPVDLGVHNTLPTRVGGRSRKQLCDFEILDGFARGKTVNGHAPTAERQSWSSRLLGNLLKPAPVETRKEFAASDGTVFGSRVALEAYERAFGLQPLAVHEANRTGAPVQAKPAKPVMCRTCNEGPFETTQRLAVHARQLHPKTGGARLKHKRAAAAAAKE